MAVSDAAWEVFKNVKRPNRYSYLSILDWKELWLEKGVWPYTTSTAEMAALNAAVTEYLDVGHEEHFRRYAEISRATRAGALAMGLELWPDKQEHAAGVATAVKVPDGIDDEELRDRMIAKFGVLISGSLANTPIYGKLVRLGHMGRTCNPSYGVIALTALGDCLREMGRRVDVGAGVDAFLSHLDPA